MTAVVLIAGNFLREQRWPVAVLLTYVFAMAILFGWYGTDAGLDDQLFFLKQQSFYAIAFGALLAAAPIHNERKSRRMLAVLSKAVTRRQYLGGLLAGVASALFLYVLAAALAVWVMSQRDGSNVVEAWRLLATAYLTALLAASLAMLFATVFHPMLAAAAAGVGLAVPMLAAQQGWAGHDVLLPSGSLLLSILAFHMQPEWIPPNHTLLAAMAHIVLWWWLAGYIFSRRDIAVAVE